MKYAEAVKIIVGLFSFSCITSVSLIAQDINLAVSNIPDSLLTGAHSVVRYDHSELEVSSASKAVLKSRTIITVLDPGGDNNLLFYEFTDKFHKLDHAEIKVYDKNGQQVSKISRKQMNMESSGSGLVEEGEVIYYKVPASFYPITIETNSEMRYKGILNYPSYSISRPNQSVQQSSFEVKVPVAVGLRYKNKHTAIKPVISEQSNLQLYKWEARSVKAVPDQPWSVSYESRYPTVLIAPNKFELDDYPGDMTSWKEFGKWFQILAKKAIDLPEPKKNIFREMVKDAQTDKEKARILYTYMQDNFRYVSIQLGIGGWRPFPASFTDAKKYGDCKALSNYMQAMLDAVGVRSHMALINAGFNKEPVDQDFSRNGFNHVILCVPNSGDSIWLECTSSTTDFGRLGNFTENRNALLITPDGGQLVRTPFSKSEENFLTVNTDIRIDKERTGKAVMRLRGTGEFKDWMISDFMHATEDKKKENIMQFLSLKDSRSCSIKLDGNMRQKTLPLLVSMEFDKVEGFKAGSKIFFDKHLHKQWTHYLPSAENRKLDVYFYYPLRRTDTTRFYLPENCKVETVPEPVAFSFALGSYSSTLKYDAASNCLISISQLELKKHVFPAKDYAEARLFFDKIGKDQTQKWIAIQQ